MCSMRRRLGAKGSAATGLHFIEAKKLINLNHGLTYSKCEHVIYTHQLIDVSNSLTQISSLMWTSKWHKTIDWREQMIDRDSRLTWTTDWQRQLIAMNYWSTKNRWFTWTTVNDWNKALGWHDKLTHDAVDWHGAVDWQRPIYWQKDIDWHEAIYCVWRTTCV